MFSLNRTEIIGYQTQPVVLRKTPSGTSVADLNIVVPYTFQSQKGDTLAGKSFHTVTVWGSMADIAGQYIRPGTQVFISGRLQTDSWEDTQTKEKRNKTKVVALDLIILDPKDGQKDPPRDAKELLSSLNRAEVIGNVTRDPEMRTTTSGQSVLTLGVATNERWRDKGSSELKERTEFHSVVVWGDLAKRVESCVKKGQRIFVAGRVQTRTWENQSGQKRATTEIIAEQVSLLGVKSLEPVISSAPVSAEASESASPAEAFEPGMTARASEPTRITVPSISYESDIKPEDLPF